MPDADERRLPEPRYQIERAGTGYRVTGPGLIVWEPTLREAAGRREELEAHGWRYPPAPAAGSGATAPIESAVYGPVTSRRLGQSLGLSLTPRGCRACTFECVYCPDSGISPSSLRGRWPKPAMIEADLEDALADTGPLDSITIAGRGEPTLHPLFPEVVDVVLGVSRRARPGVAVRVLTNGSRVLYPEIRAALDRLDERIIKFDADIDRICRPGRSSPLGAVLFGISLLKNVTLQSCFIGGVLSNADEAMIQEWLEFVSEIAPRAVQIYTIDRQPDGVDLRPVSKAQLEEIACSLRAYTGIEAAVSA